MIPGSQRTAEQHRSAGSRKARFDRPIERSSGGITGNATSHEYYRLRHDATPKADRIAMFTKTRRMSRTAGAALLVTLAVFTLGTPASAYPDVQVKNTTAFVAHVKVLYLACRNDMFSVNPGATSTPIKRAACRIRSVTANLVGGPPVRGFESPKDGTGDSKFTLVAAGAHVVVESAP
jgi:hypothetical protein